MVASDIGGCLRSDLQVKPGKVARKPNLIAWCRVDSVGLKRAT